MTRVKRGNVARQRRKRIFKLASGFRGAHSKLFRVAKQQVIKALRYSYKGRKNRKRDFRRLWIIKINAAAKEKGTTYSKLICALKKSKIGINRKMLAEICTLDSIVLDKIIETTQVKQN